MLERISLDEARSCIIDRCGRLHAGKNSSESRGQRAGNDELCLIDLEQPSALLGRTLTGDFYAPFALPRVANSAVDGYALSRADAETLFANAAAAGLDFIELPVQGKNLAGGESISRLLPGHAVQIATGARIPEGADCVVMKEQVALHAPGAIRLSFPQDAPPVTLAEAERQTSALSGNWIRNAGEDFALGALVLSAGTRIDAFTLAALQAFGQTHVALQKRPRVAVLAYGSELTAPGTALTGNQIFDCNRSSIAALLSGLGCEARCYPLFADSLQALQTQLQRAAKECDAIVCCGGASVGEADYTLAALQALSHSHVHFYRVRSKPGMPVIFAELSGIPVFALPGNPISAMISLLTIAKPGLELLCGRAATPLPHLPLQLSHSLHKKHLRREFYRAQLRHIAGTWQVHALDAQGSAQLSGMLSATGLLDVPEGEQHIAAGDWIRYLPFSELLQ